MQNINIDNLHELDGKWLEGMPKDMVIHILPNNQAQLNIEIATNHPELQALLNEHLKDDNFDQSTWFGLVAAYCGIVLDGNYQVSHLVEQLGRALIAKREPMAETIMRDRGQLESIPIMIKKSDSDSDIEDTPIQIE